VSLQYVLTLKLLTLMPLTYRRTMKESFKDVYTYTSQALDMIELEKDTNPNYNELKKLLTDQVNDELHDVTYSRVSSK
jgi:hypothetical protein